MMKDADRIVPPLPLPSASIINGKEVRLVRASNDQAAAPEMPYVVLDQLLRAMGFPDSAFANARTIIGTGCELRQADGATIAPYLMAVDLITNAIENGRASQSDLDVFCKAGVDFLIADCAGLTVEDGYERMDEAKANSEALASRQTMTRQ